MPPGWKSYKIIDDVLKTISYILPLLILLIFSALSSDAYAQVVKDQHITEVSDSAVSSSFKEKSANLKEELEKFKDVKFNFINTKEDLQSDYRDSLTIGEDNREILFPKKESVKEMSSNLAPGIDLVDSTTARRELNNLKEEFRDELEKGLNGLILTDLDKEDLSNRVDNLLNSYRNNKSYQEIADYDQNLDSKLNSFGKEEAAEEWLENKVGYARIFDVYPKEIYKDKVALNQNLKELKNLSNQKVKLLDDWGLDNSGLNEYHKYLKGQKSADELERCIKNSKAYQSNTSQRKEYKKLLKEISALDDRESRLKEEIKGNKYLEYLQKNQGETSGYLKEFDETGEFDKELFYSKLNEQAKKDDIQSLLNNSYVSDHINAHQPDLGKVGAGVIKKEVRLALDSVGEKWLDEAARIKDHSGKPDKEEVKELLVKDSHEKRLMPENAFFEGIVGFASGDFSVFSLSPNFDYEFRNGPSVGLGLTLHHTQDDQAFVRTALDYKVLGKYELINDLVFLQTEYVAMIPGMSYLDAKEGAVEFRNTVLVGGGFSIKVKGKNMLSLGLMYNLNQNMGVPTYDSPLLARFGVKLF